MDGLQEPSDPDVSGCESNSAVQTVHHDNHRPPIASSQESTYGASPMAISEKTEDKVISLPDSVTSEGDSLSHLTDSERQILREQLESPTSKVTFFMLYRYATSWDYFIIFVSVICSIAAGAATPIMMILFGNLASAFQQVWLDKIPLHTFESRLVQDVLLLVYIGIAELVTVWVSTAGFIYTGENITRHIRQEYLKAILRQNMAFFDNLGAGEITTRITTDTNLIQDGISQKVGLTLTAISTFVTAFIVAYVKFWKLALICTSSIVCLIFSMALGYRFIIRYSKKTLSTYGVGGSLAEEVISSMRMATAFGNQDRLADQYKSYLEAAEQFGIRTQTFQAAMIGSIYAIVYLNYGLGFWQAAKFLIHGELNLGDIITILLSIMSGSYTLGSVTPHSQAFTSAIAAAVKIYSTIDRQSPLDPTSTDGQVLDHVEGDIELRNVSHIYPSRPGVVVMKDVNLSVPAGRTTAIVGASGSGKSTIIGLVERFYNPVRGKVLLDGHDIRSLNLRSLRQHISLVGQQPELFRSSIYENIKHGLSNTSMEHEPEERLRERVEGAARKANAHKFIASLPEGYDTQVGERGFLLSGGQKQRIAIARAIVSDPKILMLDEATSALDTKSEEVVQNALNKASEGRTTIVIAHRLSTIKAAHNIVVMAGGKIEEQGTHDELLDAKGTYFRLVEAQNVKKAVDRDSLLEVEDGDSEEDHKEDEKMRTTTGVTAMDKTMDEEKARKSQKYSTWTLIKFIASFNRPELLLMNCGVVFAVLAGCAQPSQAVVYSMAINTLALPLDQHHKIKHDADLWALMLLIIGVVQFFLFSIQGICFGITAERLVRRSRDTAFRTVLRQDIAFFDERSTGALTSFISTETKHLSGISGVILGTICMVSTTLIASIVVSLAIGWKLSLVCIPIVPVMLFSGFWRIAMLARFQSRAQKAYEASAAYACEATSAIRTVASLSREDQVLAAYEADLLRQLRSSIFSMLKSSLLYAISQALIFFCTALGFWYGGTLLGKHDYTIFQFFSCFTLIIYGAQSAGSIFSFAPDMGKANHAASEFKTLMDRKPVIDTWSDEGEAVESISGAVEFRDVHFRYPSRPAQPVLQGLNLTIKPRQYVALVGSSGCGKSTTIALLERFYDALSGNILIDGKDVSRLNVNSYRANLALVSQEPTLYQGTIRENILLGTNRADVPEEDVIKACKDANIYDFVLSLPEGLDTTVGGKGSMLSGGQKQRVAIARALIRNPKILLLDEATSALDSESEHVVQAALDKAAKGRTTIAVAHRLSTTQNADIIYVLDQGRVVESGTHEELIRMNGRYAELVNLQNLERSS